MCVALSSNDIVEAAALSPFLGRDASGDLLVAMVMRAAESAPATTVDATFVVRRGPLPGIAILGNIDEAAAARVTALFLHIREILSRWNHVDYSQAERDCEVLAHRLEARVGWGALRSATYVAVPRGGLIVLGMLAIVMGLRRDQLGRKPDSDLAIVIDDCALTGYRLRGVIAALESERVACGFLRAPLELCDHVEEVEPRVTACVTAAPLRDLGEERMDDGYDSWVRQWSDHARGAERYWIGRPETVSFAWKEPDRSFLNEVTGQREDGWRVMPRQMCLVPRSARPTVAVVEQPNGVGPLRPSDRIFWADVDGHIVVVEPGAEHLLRLDGAAGVFWQAIVERGTLDGVVDVALDRFEVGEDLLRPDVQAFIDEMVNRGLLVQD